MGTKAIKQVSDAGGNLFNGVFQVNASNEYTQGVVISNADGDANSTTNPLYQQGTGVYYATPAALQYTANVIAGTPYTSALIDMQSQPALQVGTAYNAAHTYTITQYQDAGGTLLQGATIVLSSALVLGVYTIRQNVQITGNYIKITITSASGTIIGTTYGSIGILPVSPEVLGSNTSANSIPVVIASDQNVPANPTIVNRVPPTIKTNATRAEERANQFGEPVVTVTNPRQFALENTYGVAPINPTINTPIALGTATATAYVGTAPSILVRNAATAGGKDIYINAMELSLIGAGTGLTDLWLEVHIDTTNRFTSGGSAIAGKTLYSQSTPTAFTALNASTAIVATADGSTFTRLFRRKLRTVAPVAGDVYKLVFDSVYDGGNYALNQTVPGVYNIQAPVCVIPPVGTLLVYIFATGMTAAPTWEGTIEFIER